MNLQSQQLEVFCKMNYSKLKWVFIFYGFISYANDWGKTGHRVIGQIAEQYISEKTKKSINYLLDGLSLAYVSTYADEIKSDKNFRHLDSWHYVNLNMDESYFNSKKNPNGDIFYAINKCIEELRDNNSSKSDKSFYLKLLVHFIGDLHQPLHVGKKEDRGGNDIKLHWFDELTNLHALWDTGLIEFFKMSYSELAENLTTNHNYQETFFDDGDIYLWMLESQKIAKDIYANTKPNSKLGYEYHYKYFHKASNQLKIAGKRLAMVLNNIFDS